MPIANDVGEVAGKVWHFLDERGRSSLTAVAHGVDAFRVMVFMVVGWLAREGKVDLSQEGRVTVVCLRGD